ncbi:DUF4767 domain-containing protein [Pediococcus ethanolidurans]|uniref:DUF4767 domain-containing protein n=1 Tax=Pediococcus ethanolidurans TaxID=319653 RepID=UPI0029550EDC|nr:DUF4767 domain-containing protein [Pediococcus ethanolidurans]MDV7718716.1 DUF4767 domain-containing protein [Pediococcus ethanolidurans]
MKKIWWSLLVSLLVLTGCSTNTNKQASKSSSKTVQSTTVKKNSQVAKKTSSSKSAKRVTTKTKVATTVWNQTKRQKLAKFMQTWQTEMGQTYKGTYKGEQPDHLGIIFPKALTSSELNGKVKWGSTSVHLTWSKNGENGSEYQIVEVATGGVSGTHFPTTYLFCIHNGQPVVFMTQTTNGDVLDIQDTQNSALQTGFAKILTGSEPAVLTDASLNSDVSSDVNSSPQQWPSAYKGTWYYYDTYSKNVEHVTSGKISDVKLSYLKSTKSNWLNIRGAHQNAGDGDSEYVRYHYYDGRQIPVMMMASGAAPWFDSNAYRSEALAKQMKDFQFGDEVKTRDEDQ